MIPVTVRIFVCTEPVDMRSGFDRLALLARDKLQQDPRSGVLLVFTGRRRDRLKAMWWDHNGYCILYKRFHQAVFELPAPLEAVSGVSMRIDGQMLAALLAGKPKTRDRKAKLRVVR
jgi:transposase